MNLLVKYFSQQWVRKNVLRQSEEEIEIMDKQIEDEGNEDGGKEKTPLTCKR